MTEVETLREAARLMRERAEAATSGRWVDEYSSEAGNCVIPDDAQSTREHVARTQLFCAVYDAKHIAGMDPAVALAVADWLDATADTPAFEVWARADKGHLRNLIHAALAVARAYLREASSPRSPPSATSSGATSTPTGSPTSSLSSRPPSRGPTGYRYPPSAAPTGGQAPPHTTPKTRSGRHGGTVSTEQEKKVAALAELLHVSHKAYQVEPSCEGCAARAIRLLDSGVDVTVPPEPKYEPGQHARVVLDGSWVLGERHPANTGWLIPGDNGLFHDDEVTDVEPVAVLTAEDVRELRKNRGVSNFERFFAERGLDL